MAGQKATIDKDANDYTTPGAAPDSERETAYHSQKQTEGPNINKLSVDRNGNKPDVFSATNVKKDKTRKADQATQGTSGDMYNSMDTATLESISPFKKILASRFGLAEAENPGVAASPTTSDNPSLGMYSINNADFKQSQTNVKNLLEAIALQAAEAFETLNEATKVPTALTSELEQCADVINKLYEFATNSQNGGSSDSNSPPVENDPATMPVRREGRYMNESMKAGETYATTTHSATAVKPKKGKKMFRIKAESVTGQKFISEKMSKKKCKCAMEEMIASGAYTIVEMKKQKLSKKQKKIAALAGDKNKIDADDLATLRAKRKMHEAVVGVAKHILKNGA